MSYRDGNNERMEKVWVTSSAPLLVREFQDGKEPLAQPGRNVRVRATSVQQDRFLQAVEVRRAVWTMRQMLPDNPKRGGGQFLVEFLFKLSCHGTARRCMFVTVRHGCRCRKRAAALLPVSFE